MTSHTGGETLCETEIRPDYLMRGQAERFASDIRRLLQHKAEFVQAACPACGSNNAEQAFEKYELTYQICSVCETMYVSPRPTPVILEMYYRTSENYAYWNRYIFPASEEARREKIFRPRAERFAEICTRYGIRTESLLEVGAGFGTFCEELRRIELFTRIIAVEPTPDLAATCRRKGLEVIEQPFEHVQQEQNTFDVIASFEVIEHVFDPAAFIRHCAALLAPGGLLIITCPNVKGFDIQTLGPVSDTVDVEHLNYFHPAALAHLVAANGFEALEILTPGKLDAELVRKKALSGDYDLASQGFLHQVLIKDWERLGPLFQQFLVDNGLSSHMWLVARKPGG
jgi:2-polyprenyl-3-methyl-5-hydroxy-6-metoxy-1,4-benzoquinol methylase